MDRIKYASKEEIERISFNDKSGIVFKYDGSDRILSNNYNTLIISEDDNQKNNKIIIPFIKSIIKSNESFFINDKSGLIYDKLNKDLKDNGYKVVCLNFDNPINSDGYNILELSYNLYKNKNIDKSIELLENIAYYIFYEKSNNSDPFWIDSAINLFIGTTLYMFENSNEISLNKVSELIETIKLEDIKENTPMYNYLLAVLSAPKETKGSIFAVFRQKYNHYVSKDYLKKMLSNSTFDLNDIYNNKLALFIIEGTNNISSNIVSLLTNQIYYICKLNKKNKKINIILDNFDNLVPIKDVEDVIYMCSNLNINVTTFVKNFTSLNNLYSKEIGDNLKVVFKNIIYLYSDDIETLEYLSNRCGSMEYISFLRNIKEDEALFIVIRMNPFIVNI